MRILPPSSGRTRDQGPPAGLHAYRRESEGERTQIHLRVEDGGRGLLLINANRALHLNETATFMAWMVLEGFSTPEAITRLRKRFHVDARQAAADYTRIEGQLTEITRPDGACPIHDLDFEVLLPFSQKPAAPYRMDLALTYRCNANCHHCYNARSRSYPEMPTQDWYRVIDRLWELGVPHICFTGGEATLRNDLPELVAYAQEKGQITGLLSNGRRLSDADYVQALVRSGLDHVQITFESCDETIHDRMVGARGAWKDTVSGIRNCVQSDLYLMTNTTLLRDNIDTIEDTIGFLADLQVPTLGFNALIYSGKGKDVGTGLREEELIPLLSMVRKKTAANGQRLIWYTPTQYCHFDPVQLQLGVKGCTAALYNMCIEPDGGVIPCQSFYQQLGNILTDTWDMIWDHEIANWLRDRRYVAETCHDCPALNECGGGCPLTLLHQDSQLPRVPDPIRHDFVMEG
jgi:radical SAM protein with 4Fe4S-binding SPASM domain